MKKSIGFTACAFLVLFFFPGLIFGADLTGDINGDGKIDLKTNSKEEITCLEP